MGNLHGWQGIRVPGYPCISSETVGGLSALNFLLETGMDKIFRDQTLGLFDVTPFSRTKCRALLPGGTEPGECPPNLE